MTQPRSRLLALVVSLGLGCSAGVKMNMPGTGGSAGGSSGAAGAGGGGGGGRGGTTGAGGLPVPDGSIDTGPIDPDAACSTSAALAEPVPLDLYLLMDTSLSMQEATAAGPSKWDAVKAAMTAFFGDGASSGLGIGLKYFPGIQAGPPATCTTDAECGSHGPCDRRRACVRNNTSGVVDGSSTLCTGTCPDARDVCALVQTCGNNTYCAAAGTGMCQQTCSEFAGYCRGRDICDGATSGYYATPDVPVASLPGAAAALQSSLAARSPAGYTPTGPVLAGGIGFARTRLQTVTDHKIAVVLVTDGLPGGFIPGMPPAECAPADIAGVASIAATGAAGTPPVLTFVIGVFSPQTQATAQANLNMLAASGGTGAAVIIDTNQNVTQRLQEELKRVQTKAIACEYKVPSTGVDFNKVNVDFTGGTGTVTHLGQRTNAAACDTRGGWYYDVSPTAGTPTKITACPASCSMFQTDPSGRVDVILGCPTIIVD